MPLTLTGTGDDLDEDGRHIRYPRSRSNEDEVRLFLQPGMPVRVARSKRAAKMYTVTKLDDEFVYVAPIRSYRSAVANSL
jgi:hypothetical protein